MRRSMGLFIRFLLHFGHKNGWIDWDDVMIQITRLMTRLSKDMVDSALTLNN